jgi:monoamine oxidase
MDRIPYAFAKSLGKIVKYKSPVREIRKTPNGVRVVYLDEGSHAARSLEASFCICTLPASIPRTTPNDFAPRIVSAINQVGYASGYKIAWESRRFWEQDDNIYGGISWLDTGPISLESGGVLANVWYPSGGML